MGKREAERKKTFEEITLPPRAASTEASDRDLEMYYFSSAHLPTGLVSLPLLATTRAKVKG